MTYTAMVKDAQRHAVRCFGLVGLGAVVSGCVGSIGLADNRGATSVAPKMGDTTPQAEPAVNTVATVTTTIPATPAIPAAPAGPQPAARLRKLTASEFGNSVRDLLGVDVAPSAIEPDLEIDGLFAVGAAVVATSPSGVARYESVLMAATERAFATAATAGKILSCVPTTPADPACATVALNAFGRRAFRRPLTTVEIARYVGIAQIIGQETGSSALTGMRYAVDTILQSPNFLYRVELGAPSGVDGGRLKYSGFEMASRLAAFLWRTVPDDVLLDAAAQGELLTAEGVSKQAARMLAHANVHRALTDFVDDLYGTLHLYSAIKDNALYRAWTPGLRDAMREDLLRRWDDIVFGTPGDVLSLYDGKTVFVNNELGRLYGLPVQAVDGFRRVDLADDSPRRGLLASGAVLATYGLPQRTSPTQRGRFVAEMLLCKTVPLPPSDVDATLDTTTDKNATLRQSLELHRATPACRGCHGLMDPIGLGLENFDTIGTYRVVDGGQPIDASGVLDGAAFRNAAELGVRMRQHPEAGPCLVRHLYSLAQGRSPMEVDGPALQDLSTQFAKGGNRADRLMSDLVAAPSFRFVEPIK